MASIVLTEEEEREKYTYISEMMRRNYKKTSG